MAESYIRWQKSDYAKLRKAVSDFNKKLRRLQKVEYEAYLPNFISYKDIKSEILSRRDLNNTINSLRRFQKEGAEDIYTTEAGEQISKWERRELGIKSRAIQIRLNKELKELETPLESGFSRAQMGAGRVKEIKNQIKRYKSLEKLKGFEFSSTLRSIKSQYKMNDLRKAEIYQENYLTMIKKEFSGYDNYEDLVNFVKSFSNPLEFWKAVKDNEKFNDITFMYDEVDTQNKLNSLLDDMGIINLKKEFIESDVDTRSNSKAFRFTEYT